MLYLFALLVFSVFIINFPILVKYKNDNYSRIFESTITILFLLLVTFRPVNIIPDVINYKTAFERITVGYQGFNPLIRDYTTAMEYGFVYLMILFKALGLNYYFFTFFISCVSIICIKKFVYSYVVSYHREETDFNFRYLYFFGAYIVYYGLYYNFITIRSLLAIDFLLFAFIAIKKKKIIRSIIFIALSFYIHRLAIVGIAFYIVLFIEKKHLLNRYKFYLISFFIFFLLEWKFEFIKNVIILILKPLLQKLEYMTYASRKSEGGIARFLQILLWFMNSFIIYDFLRRSNRRTLVYDLLIIQMIGLIIATVFCKQEGAYRIFDFFMIFILPINCLIICDRKYLYKSIKRKLFFIINQNLFLLISFRSFAMVFLQG